MASHHAKIEREGKPPIDHPDVTVQERQDPSGLRSWQGFFWYAGDAPFDVTDELRITLLKNGRTGRAFIQGVEIRSGVRGQLVRFHGSDLLAERPGGDTQQSAM